MKKPQGVEEMAGLLKAAAAVPLHAVGPLPVVQDRPAKAKKGASVGVFMRIPAEVHAKLEAEAVARTKETGKGVTIQQVILDRMAGQS